MRVRHNYRASWTASIRRCGQLSCAIHHAQIIAIVKSMPIPFARTARVIGIIPAAQLQEVQTELRQTQRAGDSKRAQLQGLEGQYMQVRLAYADETLLCTVAVAASRCYRASPVALGILWQGRLHRNRRAARRTPSGATACRRRRTSTRACCRTGTGPSAPRAPTSASPSQVCLRQHLASSMCTNVCFADAFLPCRLSGRCMRGMHELMHQDGLRILWRVMLGAQAKSCTLPQAVRDPCQMRRCVRSTWHSRDARRSCRHRCRMPAGRTAAQTSRCATCWCSSLWKGTPISIVQVAVVITVLQQCETQLVALTQMSARLDGVTGEVAGLREAIRQKQQQLDTFEARKASLEQQVRTTF